MAFLLQNDDGTVENANAYIDVAFFNTYFGDRKIDVSGHPDSDIQAAIIVATDYVDIRFSYFGFKIEGDDQTTEWPRNVEDKIPTLIKEATAEYAKRVLTNGQLLTDPDHDPSGKIVEKIEKVGPLSETTRYSEFGPTYELPNYPIADKKILRTGHVSVATSFLVR